MNGTMVKLASPKQLKWLQDLLTRDYTSFPEDWRKVCDRLNDLFEKLAMDGYEAESLNVWIEANEGDPLTMADFQRLLPKLQACPKAAKTAQAAKPQVTEDGIYRNGDKVYKVYWNQSETRLLAKILVIVTPATEDTIAVSEWVYKGAADRFVTPDQIMDLTMEQAREFGALYGRCSECGRVLSNELSIKLGIGPVCGAREFGGEFKFMLDEVKAGLTEK